MTSSQDRVATTRRASEASGDCPSMPLPPFRPGVVPSHIGEVDEASTRRFGETVGALREDAQVAKTASAVAAAWWEARRQARCGGIGGASRPLVARLLGPCCGTGDGLVSAGDQ